MAARTLGDTLATCTLEFLLENLSIQGAFVGKKVRIYSGEHLAWWRAEGAGYTARKAFAGVYEFDDAYARVSHCGPSKKIRLEVLR